MDGAWARESWVGNGTLHAPNGTTAPDATPLTPTVQVGGGRAVHPAPCAVGPHSAQPCVIAHGLQLEGGAQQVGCPAPIGSYLPTASSTQYKRRTRSGEGVAWQRTAACHPTYLTGGKKVGPGPVQPAARGLGGGPSPAHSGHEPQTGVHALSAIHIVPGRPAEVGAGRNMNRAKCIAATAAIACSTGCHRGAGSAGVRGIGWARQALQRRAGGESTGRAGNAPRAAHSCGAHVATQRGAWPRARAVNGSLRAVPGHTCWVHQL
jgi:hypothetical protein